MIPYDDLVASLQRWRTKQGLPSLTPATSSAPPPAVAPLPSTGYGGPPQPQGDAWAGGATAVTSNFAALNEYEQVTPSPHGREDERTGELDLDTADVVEE